MQRQRLVGVLAFVFPLFLYLLLSLYQIGLPGPNYDEAVEAKAAVQLLRGLPVEAHRRATVDLFGKQLPLMIVDYVGALNTYGLLLFFKVGSIGVATMRLWSITIGAVTLWLVYYLAKLTSGQRAAFLAAFILAVQPSYIFFTRQGIYVTNTTLAFSLAILVALWLWIHTAKMRWWYLATFLAGVGLWAKLIMLWPLVATALLIPLVWWQRQRFGLKPAQEFSPRCLLQPQTIVFSLAVLLLGLAPFLVFNIKTGATFAHLLGTLNESYYGVANTDYLTNLFVRWGQLADYARGNHFWYLGGNFNDILAWPAWLLGLPLVVVILLAGRKSPDTVALALRGLFFYAFLLIVLLQSPLTQTALWYTHLAFFSPFLALGIAAAWDLLFRRFRAPWSTILTLIFALALGGSSLRADVGYHQTLATTGGYADHSDASYRLADTLMANGLQSPYALDWGFEAPLILVSTGYINPIEIFGYQRLDAPDEDFAARLEPLLTDPKNVFLFHAPDRTNFHGRREAVITLAAELGISLETIAVISERSGAPHTEIVRPLQ